MAVPQQRSLPWAVYVLSVALFFGLWQWGSAVMSPLFLPSPGATFQTGIKLIGNGVLTASTQVSLLRILAGLVIGTTIGIVLGQAMGRSLILNAILSPYVSIFRFIPTIAILPLALLWFGPNEASKVFLVAYSSIFIVALGTAAASAAVPEAAIRAAQSLGASRTQIFFGVVLPSSLPGMVNASLIALGFGFMVIVSAEMVGSRSGLGYIVSQGRQLNATSQIFVGIAALGVAGMVLDKICRSLVNRLFSRFGVNE